jgi:hypothetical protein
VSGRSRRRRGGAGLLPDKLHVMMPGVQTDRLGVWELLHSWAGCSQILLSYAGVLLLDLSTRFDLHVSLVGLKWMLSTVLCCLSADERWCHPLIHWIYCSLPGLHRQRCGDWEAGGKKYLVLPTNSSAVCREWSAKFELPILSNGLRTSCLSVLSVLVRTFAEFVYFVFRFIYWTWEDNTPF